MESRLYNARYVYFSRLLSILVYPYFFFINIFKKKYSLEELKVKNILVTEYHRIGDVIIIAPILKSIKNKFPNSNLILICNKQVAHLANHLNLMKTRLENGCSMSCQVIIKLLQHHRAIKIKLE